MKSWKLYLFVLILFQVSTPIQAQHILQGQLFQASEVEFELVNGFAFQNSILVRISGEPYGHFNGTVGMRAQKLQSLINELNSAKETGGNFYLPTGARFQKGAPVVQSIIHFPIDQRDNAIEQEISKQCAPLIEEHQARINNVFLDLKQEVQQEERQARSPASL